MTYHVPVTDEAVQEAATKMMPSQSLKSIRDFDVHYTPQNEFMMGLYVASKPGSRKRPKKFDSRADVIRALRRGDIETGDPVEVR